MTIYFARNDSAAFPGAVVSIAAGSFRSDYVSESFLTRGDQANPTVTSITRIPPVAGNVTWIHFQYYKPVSNSGSNAQGNQLLELRSGTGTLILDFNVSFGEVECRLFGSATKTVEIPGRLDNIAVQAIDIKIDLTSDITVEIYQNSGLVYNESQAWTSSPGNPELIYWRLFDLLVGSGTVEQSVSELIIADESTIHLGLSEMVPNAAGNYSQWIGNHIETGDADLGTGAASDAINQKLSSAMTAFAGPASSAMRAFLIVSKASTRGVTVGDLRNFLRISATDYNGAALGVGEGIESHVTVWDTNPNTLTDWDTADFSGVEIGTET